MAHTGATQALTGARESCFPCLKIIFVHYYRFSSVTTGKLPPNYITKSEAINAGWKPSKALNNYAKGAQIGGDRFLNKEGVLPNAVGREWYEADIGLNNSISRAKQAGTRLLYSNDGLLYVTYDHYKTAHSIGLWK